MRLKDLLHEQLYEGQKEMFKDLLDAGKREINKRKDDIYIIQKEVLADIVEGAKAELRKHALQGILKVADVIEKKVPFIGGIISKALRKFRETMVEALI